MKTLLICVGTGGVFYHGLTRMVNWCHRRGDVKVVLIDPDTVEARNGMRQWSTGVGKAKVSVAGQILWALGIPATKTELHIKGVKGPEDLAKIVSTRILNKAERIMVISAPDGHECRMDVHRGAELLAGKAGKDVMEITAGNSEDNGYAYGCIHTHRKGKYRCIGDFLNRHPDIAEEAELERQAKTQRMPCGMLGSPVGMVEQSTGGNHLTAFCVWDLAERIVGDEKPGEVLWMNMGINTMNILRIDTSKKVKKGERR